MRKNTLFLAHQIARFGAMTISQMQLACSGKCERATIYRTLRDLMISKDVIKTWNLGSSEFIYQATNRLYEKVYGGNHKKSSGICERNILHTVAVAQTFVTLSRYAFVNGIATEYEIDPTDLPKFCYSKVPDGLIQIEDGSQSFVLAVEIEFTQKNEILIDELLQKYRITLSKGMICAGAIIVVKNDAILKAYQAKISKLLAEFEDRVLVVTFDGLTKLNQKYFGELRISTQGSLEKIATTSQSGISFSLMKTSYPITQPPLKHTYAQGVSILKQKEIYEESHQSAISANDINLSKLCS